MIPKTNRFHGHNSLSTVYRKGQTVSLEQISLKHLAIKPDKPQRLAIVVSRKVDKSAVVRNRIRRRIYEIVRQKFPKLSQNADMVITVHSASIATIDSTDLEDLVKQLLKKSGLIEP